MTYYETLQRNSRFFVSCVLLFLMGCQGKQAQQWGEWSSDNGKLKVLSTIGMIDDLVKQVGGEHVDTMVLVRGDLDPHNYQLVKGDDEKLLAADVIFYNGLGLEHNPSLSYHLKNNEQAVSLGARVRQRVSSQILYADGKPDPHIWMDISLWSHIVPFIVDELSKRDPDHAEVFRQKGEELVVALQESHRRVENSLSQVPETRRFLVSSHDAFCYFARAYLATDRERKEGGWRKRVASPEGLSPESQISSRDIQRIIDYVKRYHIPVIFPESNVSKDSVRKIVQAGKKLGIDLEIAKGPLYADAMGPPGSGAETYVGMVLHNTELLVRNLSPSPEQEGTH